MMRFQLQQVIKKSFFNKNIIKEKAGLETKDYIHNHTPGEITRLQLAERLDIIRNLRASSVIWGKLQISKAT